MKIIKAMSVLREACGRPSSFEGTISDILRALAEENPEPIDESQVFCPPPEFAQLSAELARLREQYQSACIEIGKLKKERSWIPCSERLPEDDVAVLGYGPGYTLPCVLAHIGRWRAWVFCGQRLSEDTISRWMPLPEPLKESNG